MPNFFTQVGRGIGHAASQVGDAASDLGQNFMYAAPYLYAIQRQRDADQQRKQMAIAQIAETNARQRYYDAGADARGDVPVEYKQDENGNYVALPRRAGRSSIGTPSTGGPSDFTVRPLTPGNFTPPPLTLNPQTDAPAAPKPSTPFKVDLDANGMPTTPAGTSSPTTAGALQGTQPAPQTGAEGSQGRSSPTRPVAPVATGVRGPAKMGQKVTGIVNGRSVVGTISPSGVFTPDTTAQGDTVFAASRTPAQRQTRGVVDGKAVVGTVGPNNVFSADTTAQGDTLYAPPSARGAGSDADLNHTINNVRAQIAQTQTQLSLATKQATSASDRFATPQQRTAGAAAAVAATKLKQRLDSLTAVHDNLIARQQGAIGTPPNGTNAPAAPSGTGNTSAGGSAYRLTPDLQTQMQAEFDEASSNLQAILNSGAPAQVKSRARNLYNQQQVSIAQKYRTGLGSP